MISQMGTLAGIDLYVDDHLPPDVDWWLRPHDWLDEKVRDELNRSLFQMFGHRAHPAYYIMPDKQAVVTTEIGLRVLGQACGVVYDDK